MKVLEVKEKETFLKTVPLLVKSHSLLGWIKMEQF